MGFILESECIDFEINQGMTEEDTRVVSEYLRNYKSERD